MKPKAMRGVGLLLFLLGVVLLIAFAFVDTSNGLAVLGQLVAAIVLLAAGLWLLGKSRGVPLGSIS